MKDIPPSNHLCMYITERYRQLTIVCHTDYYRPLEVFVKIKSTYFLCHLSCLNTHSTYPNSKKDTEIRRRELLESISPALLNYLQGHVQEVVLDKSACVLVSDILGAATGDVQPAMNAIASLASAELHPGGKDGEVMCYYYKTGWKAVVTEGCLVIETIAIKRILIIIISTHCISTVHLKFVNSKHNAVITLSVSETCSDAMHKNKIHLMWLSVVHERPQAAFPAYPLLLILF